MATTTFIESGSDSTQGFEFYQKTFTGTGATVASDSTQSKDGPRSIKCDVANIDQFAYFVTPNAVVSDAGALISAWVRLSTASPSETGLIILVEMATDGSGIIGIGLNTNGTLFVKGRGCTAKNGSTVLSANTWYRISLGYIITTSSNWSATAYINGASEVSTSNADGTLTAVTTSCVVLMICSTIPTGRRKRSCSRSRRFKTS